MVKTIQVSIRRRPDMAKKGNVSDIRETEYKDEKKKQTAILISDIIEESGLSQKKFAEKIQVSLATLTNALRPFHNKVPSKALLRKIAEQTDDPEDSYYSLMRAAGYDVKEFPYNIVDNIGIVKVSEEKILFDLSSRISKMAIRGTISTDYKLKGAYPYDMAVEYIDENAPINLWLVEVSISSRLPESVVKDFLYRASKKGLSVDKTKHSLITTSKRVVEEFKSLDIPALQLLMSVILYDNGAFNEYYIKTGIDHCDLDKAGLSLCDG